MNIKTNTKTTKKIKFQCRIYIKIINQLKIKSNYEDQTIDAAN